MATVNYARPRLCQQDNYTDAGKRKDLERKDTQQIIQHSYTTIKTGNITVPITCNIYILAPSSYDSLVTNPINMLICNNHT